MNNKKFPFGTRGIWHRCASEERKAKDVPVVVLEHLSDGTMYIFTFEKAPTLTHRTATIFESAFTPTRRVVIH
jgi:hypothetical protein